METTLTTLEDILTSIDHPLIKALHTNISKYVKRLHYLLWANERNYVGPLADGFQVTEWISVSLLISDWFLELVVDIKSNNTEIQNTIQEIRDNPDMVATFTLEFLTKLIEQDVIETGDKQEILLLLQNRVLINVVTSHVGQIYEYLDAQFTTSCGWWAYKTEHKLMTTISKKDGQRAYKANRRLVKRKVMFNLENET